ncbi:hypothetical protein GCM10028805_32370 [Spirosoma harenae]
MKNFLLVFSLFIASVAYQPAKAQVNVNINIGSQPLWGPTGYDYVDYYYFPDLDIYYYVPLQQWIYFNGGRWITTTVLPPRYNSYDLYRLHKVVINEKQPYLRNNVYRTRYSSFRGKYDQQPIRDSRDSRYYVINNHPMHGKAPVTNRQPMRNQPSNNNRPGGRDEHQAKGRPQGNSRDNGRPHSEERGPR